METNSPVLTATHTPHQIQTETPKADIWEIETCRKAPGIIPNGQYNWIQEYVGDIEGRGKMDMLLNFTKSKEILGFAFDFEQVREYQIYGCVNGRANP